MKVWHLSRATGGSPSGEDVGPQVAVADGLGLLPRTRPGSLSGRDSPNGSPPCSTWLSAPDRRRVVMRFHVETKSVPATTARAGASRSIGTEAARFGFHFMQ